MELRQLEYLVAVAEEASFTRAAGRVHISQSGVSAQVRQLERELGAALVDRSSRAARLTDAGTAALPHARAALDAASALRQAVDEVNGLVRGRLTVGMVTACTVPGLFDALAAFRRAHPGVALTLAEDDSAALTRRVRSGTADLALARRSPAPRHGTWACCPSSPSGSSPPSRPATPCCPGAPRSRWPRSPGTRSCACPPEPASGAALDASCAAAGVRLDVTLEASAPGAVADLTARGLGVAVLSESMAAARPGLCPVPIEGPLVTASLALIWRPPPGPALRELIARCRRAFATAAAPAGDPS